ncbi:MAG: carboxypeptidase-like regulatory domain-containing protein [Bacteroidales bacterium]
MKNLITILMTVMLVAGLNNLTIASSDDENNENNEKMTTSLKGKVVDQSTGEELTGVKVEIKGTEKEVYTDFEGNFNFSELRPGKYNVSASYISYKDQEFSDVKLEISDENSITLKLESVEE